MRTVDAELSALMAAGTGNPTITAHIYAAGGVAPLISRTPRGYQLQGTHLEIDIPEVTLGDTGFEVTLERGLTINGIDNTITTSRFYVQGGTSDFNKTQSTKIKAELFKDIYISLTGDVSYRTIIEDYCSQFGKTATFKNDTAPFWDFQFLPTGKSVTTNNALSFLNQLKQKYFIFCCDNGGEDVLFYNALDVIENAADYEIQNEYQELELSTQLFRKLIARDENGSLRTFGASTIPIHNMGFILSTDDLPTTNRQPLLYRFQKAILDFKYQDGDSIDWGGDEPIAPAIITEYFDQKSTPTWGVNISQSKFFTNTEGGALPSTIERNAPYTPLNTGTFDNNLDSSVNNLQALAEAVDELDLGSTDEEIQDLVGAMVTGNTETGIAVTYDDTSGKLNFDAQTAGDARYAPIAKGVTNGDAHDHNGGDGGTISYPNLSNRPGMADSDTILYNSPAGVSSSAFSGTIATLPGGKTLTYTPTGGNENTLPQDAAGTLRIAQQRIYNTTRGTYALIDTVNTGTNTIVLVDNVPSGWTVGDVITTLSQTVSGGGFNWVDLEVTSDTFLGKSYVEIYLFLTDTGGAGAILRIHPFETYAASKVVRVTTQSTQQNSFILPMSLNSNIISAAWIATGAGTLTFSIRQKTIFE